MAHAARVFYVQATGAVVAYGTLHWENGADWDPAVHAFADCPVILPSSRFVTVLPGGSVQYNWTYDPATQTVSG
jgi:hypothetical protein